MIGINRKIFKVHERCARGVVLPKGLWLLGWAVQVLVLAEIVVACSQARYRYCGLTVLLFPPKFIFSTGGQNFFEGMGREDGKWDSQGGTKWEKFSKEKVCYTENSK